MSIAWAPRHKADSWEPVPTQQAEFGAWLVAEGTASAPVLERAARLAQDSGERLEVVLTRMGLVSERGMAEAQARFLCLDMATASDFPQEPVLEAVLNKRFLKEFRAIPLRDADPLPLAVAAPADPFPAAALRFALGRDVRYLVAYPADIDAAYERLYGDGQSEITQLVQEARTHDDDNADDIERLKDIASEAPVIRLVNLLISRAVECRASDIHIEPTENQLRVRYRIDGVLREAEAPPQRLRAAVISRVKVMAKLNIAERRLAQDGRIRIAVRGTEMDFRVSTSPTIHGESVVIRILDRSSLHLDFTDLESVRRGPLPRTAVQASTFYRIDWTPGVSFSHFWGA